ncbi:hypothetical protein L3X38_003960 [Prunus dulcis]|uniref:Uncharacterized protein n=1 Tax=Prunus dulcis TaxID=3755 RepID=A0AAD4ZN37_PRUDU|nr:hypothetical protein L3X38_003960 [Prunus dulcis]
MSWLILGNEKLSSGHALLSFDDRDPLGNEVEGLTWKVDVEGSMSSMSDGDHVNMSLLFWRKLVSSTFSSELRREPICPFLSGWSGSKGFSLMSSSGFHPSSGETSGKIFSAWS